MRRDQGQHGSTELIGEPSAAWPATLARDQAVGAFGGYRRTQSLNLTHAEIQDPGGLDLREAAFADSGNNAEPIELLMTHRDRPGGHVGKLPMPRNTTLLRWRNPTFER